MKKKLLFLLAPSLLLSLVGCGGNNSSPTSPSSPSTPPITTPITSGGGGSSTAPTTGTKPEYVIPTDLAEMYNAVKAAMDGTTYVGFEAKVVGLQQYSNNENVNIYLQNGVYGYRINNVPTSLNVQVGQSYRVYGYGAGANRKYVGLNYAAKNVEAPMTLELLSTEVSAPVIPYTDDIDLSVSTSAKVSGQGKITVVGSSTLTLDIGGGKTVELSWMTKTIGGAAVAEKLGTLYVGQDITFSGCPYDNSKKSISILDAADITAGEVVVDGVVSNINLDSSLVATVNGNTIAYSGTVGWVAADSQGRYQRGNALGLKVTKHPAVTDLSAVTVSASGFGYDTPKTFTNAELVEKKMLVADGLEFYVNLTADPDYKGQATVYTITWMTGKTQQVTVAYAADLALEAEPSEELNATVNVAEGLTKEETPVESAVNTTALVVKTGEVKYVTGKGNVLEVLLTVPTGADATPTINVTKNGSPLAELEKATEGGVVTLSLPVEALTDTFSISAQWKSTAKWQTINVSMDSAVTLQAAPTPGPSDVADAKLVFKTSANDTTQAVSAANFITNSINEETSVNTTLISECTAADKIYPNSIGGIKFGSSKGAGSFTITTTKGVTKVVVYVAKFGSDALGLKINDTDVTSDITDGKVVYTFSEAVTSITISSSPKRVYVSQIEFYTVD